MHCCKSDYLNMTQITRQVSVSFQFKSKSVNNILAGFVCVFRHVLAVEIAMTSKPYVRATLVTFQKNN